MKGFGKLGCVHALLPEASTELNRQGQNIRPGNGGGRLIDPKTTLAYPATVARRATLARCTVALLAIATQAQQILFFRGAKDVDNSSRGLTPPQDAGGLTPQLGICLYW